MTEMFHRILSGDKA